RAGRVRVFGDLNHHARSGTCISTVSKQVRAPDLIADLAVVVLVHGDADIRQSLRATAVLARINVDLIDVNLRLEVDAVGEARSGRGVAVHHIRTVAIHD